jgi:hypothetical protein
MVAILTIDFTEAFDHANDCISRLLRFEAIVLQNRSILTFLNWIRSPLLISYCPLKLKKIENSQ